MNDLDYLNLAEKLLASVEQCCDRINDTTDADIDCQRVGGMITLVFRNRSQMVVNMQKPLHEIWLAAKDGGYHYRWNAQDGVWSDTKTSAEFYADLSRCASQQAGSSIIFKPQV
jgi:CyaY protein